VWSLIVESDHTQVMKPCFSGCGLETKVVRSGLGEDR
jgi:hypothetical protein